MTVLAVIPARGGSKGILRKNLALLAGKPLIAHTIETDRLPEQGPVRRPPVCLVVTVGPSLLQLSELRRIARLGHIAFRLNAAHGAPETVAAQAALLAHHLPQAPLWLDLPGRKIRLTGLEAPLAFRTGEVVTLLSRHFNIPRIATRLSQGQVVLASDGTVRLRVRAATRARVQLRALTDGALVNGKGIHVAGILEDIPLLLDDDLALLRAVAGRRIAHVGLSFVCTPADVTSGAETIHRFLPQAHVVPKIEMAGALASLAGILPLTDTVLLDRGDLAGEIGLENVPEAQDQVLRMCRRNQVRVIVATQLLRSMQERRIPVIAELTELYHLLEAGVYGLQLSEETAVGRFPEACIQLILAMSRRIAARR